MSLAKVDINLERGQLQVVRGKTPARASDVEPYDRERANTGCQDGRSFPMDISVEAESPEAYQQIEQRT
jgi:hypothetical protein